MSVGDPVRVSWTRLRCVSGTSDKQYEMQLLGWPHLDAVGRPDLYTVRFSYGRTGAANPRVGYKDSGGRSWDSPRYMTLPQASSIFRKVLKDKRAKGYREIDDAGARRHVTLSSTTASTGPARPPARTGSKYQVPRRSISLDED